MLGCSGGPSALEPPSIDAASAASQAMELYDKDGDGSIAGAELDAAGSLKASMKTVDANGDGAVQEQEIADRIIAWQTSGKGLTSLTCTVTLDGRPLPGATVTFEPEPWLGDEMKEAFGETNAMGMTGLSIPKENRVPADAPPGLQLGFFRVKVSKQVGGAETIPPKYNADTVLGQQVALDDPAVANQQVRFELKK